MSKIDDLTKRVERAEWIAQSALDTVATKVIQTAPVSMEDFATFRLGILGLLLERLCDEDQNPVMLSKLVKRMDTYEATGHEHDGGDGHVRADSHVHPDNHYSGEDHHHLHPELIRSLPTSAQAPTPTVIQVVQAPIVVVPIVSWSNPPAMHHGGPFYIYIEFSESLKVGFRTVKDHGFEVEGGKVTGVNRVQGRSDKWRICVKPKRRLDCAITSTAALVGVSGQAPHPISTVVAYAG